MNHGQNNNMKPFTKRRDHHGIHMENFVDRIWRTNLVKESISDFIENTKIYGHLRWITSWNLDRALGLYIQSKFYEKGKIIGHWMPEPAQFLKSCYPSEDTHGRNHGASDFLLIKRFPQYGYLWNLAFSQLWNIIKRPFKYLFKKLRLVLGKKK